jgi:putative DNA methylase
VLIALSVHRSASTPSAKNRSRHFRTVGADVPSSEATAVVLPPPASVTQVFSQNAYPKRVPEAHIVCPACLDVIPGRYDFSELTCKNGHLVKRSGAVTRSTMTCPRGHTSKVLDALAGGLPRYEMYAKLVLGFDGRKRYERITDCDRALYAECAQLLRQRSGELVLPAGELDEGENTRQTIRWGFTKWRHFFNERQLYSLGLLGSAIREVSAGAAEREALAALFSGTLEFNNMFCSFKGEGTGAVRHVFSHHILKPERTPLEAHPWGTPASSGSFSTLFRSRLLRARDYKLLPTDQVLSGEDVVRVEGLSLPAESNVVDSWPEAGLVQGSAYLRTGDSSHTDLPGESVDLIVTDPIHGQRPLFRAGRLLPRLAPGGCAPCRLPTRAGHDQERG